MREHHIDLTLPHANPWYLWILGSQWGRVGHHQPYYPHAFVGGVRNPSSSAEGNFQILKWSLVDESSPLGSATMLEDKVVQAVRLSWRKTDLTNTRPMIPSIRSTEGTAIGLDVVQSKRVVDVLSQEPEIERIVVVRIRLRTIGSDPGLVCSPLTGDLLADSDPVVEGHVAVASSTPHAPPRYKPDSR